MNARKQRIPKLRRPSYQDGDWRVYPGDVTLRIISGDVEMALPDDYYDLKES